jgi:purine-binding chemotaxis protein CheW
VSTDVQKHSSSAQALWDAASTMAGKFMTFKLGDEEYAIEILKVREIIGLINLRGKVVPVVDLRVKFGMTATAATEQTVIIVVQCAIGGRELTMGILVDQVLEVLPLEASQIEPPPSFGTAEVDAGFILGVGKAEKRVIFLLDIGKVLSAAEARELAVAGSA